MGKFPGRSWVGFGGAHGPRKAHARALYALHVGGQGVPDCHWVWEAFVTLKSLGVAAVHYLKGGRTLREEPSLGLTCSLDFLLRSLSSSDLCHLAVE